MQKYNDSIVDAAPLTDQNGEVHELSRADFARFKPIRDVLPPELLNKLCVDPNVEAVTKTHKPLTHKEPRKEPVVEVPQYIVQKFKRTGRGWQNRLRIALDGLMNPLHDDLKKVKHQNSKTG